MSSVGIVGYSCDSGLGIQNQTFFRKLGFTKWLVVEHFQYGIRSDHLRDGCTVLRKALCAPRTPEDFHDLVKTTDEFLDGLDTVFVIERSFAPTLWLQAKAKGIRTVLMPNEEWFSPGDPSLTRIDSFIAPTQSCASYLERHGLGERTTYIPHPIDMERFAFRPRDRAECFVHYSGRGGYKSRKGTPLVIAAAQRCLDIPVLIFAQYEISGDLPSNIRLMGSTYEPHEQYYSGDIAVQPSRWEGTGVQILEAMSSGLPTLTTNAPPMNEYVTDETLLLDAVPSQEELRDSIFPRKLWTAWDANVKSLVERFRLLHGTLIKERSLAARTAVELHSWEKLKPQLKAAIEGCR